MAKSKAVATTNNPRPDRSLRARVARIDPTVLAAGAVVAGAVAGVLVPRSATETRLLGPLGKQLNVAVGSLGTAARQVVSNELAGVPMVGQIAVDQLDRVLDAA